MPQGFQIGGLILAAAALTALAFWIIRRMRTTPEQRERKRRLLVHQTGRLGDAQITEVAENTLFYSYVARGVQYATSQDVTAMCDRLPRNLERLIGPAGLKYMVNNPANSIVVCEEWNGLRAIKETAESATASPLLDMNSVGHQPEDSALT